MAFQYLKLVIDDKIACVVLNRPEALNALSTGLMSEIEQASRAFLDDEEIRAVVFMGEGKHFSAGADLKEPRSTDETSLLMRRRRAGLGARMIRAILDINQVTICAIQGAALGGAACIATACDFRVGSDDCFCGYPEVNLGINLMWRSLPLCVRLIGPARAKRMIMLGHQEPAALLKEWGFLDEVVPRADLQTAALAMARQYAGQPPIATQMIKQSVNAVSSAFDDAIMHMDTDQNILTTTTDDRSEGIKAFFEKRTPKFTGN